MSAVEIVHFCLGCGKTYSEEEYRALPTVRLEGRKVDWPTCECGNIWFLHEEQADEDDAA